ncbi:MAG: hypothetical protein ACI8Y4_004805 [Candidatus Poriferisodalaceae bacterium]|jgi:hypothetical protein
MSDEQSERREFTAEDDHLHTAVMSDRWWMTETCWFSFHNEERKLGGWFYTMIRPNIGTIAGGAWIWDDTAAIPWEVPYSVNYSALQLPDDADFTKITLPTGVSIEVLEPTMSYRLGFDDPGRLTADLRWDGVMAPEPLTAVGSTFGSAHHYDQFGHVTGTITLNGEVIEIDSISMRDRTWGPRPEHRPRKAGYVTGAVDADHGFLAVTNTVGDEDRVAYGFLRRDGRTVSLAGGERRVQRDPVEGWISEISIDATDNEGRLLSVIGTPVSRIIINRHSFVDINSLVKWTFKSDGGDQDGWGEDQDMWPMLEFAEYTRERRAAGHNR